MKSLDQIKSSRGEINLVIGSQTLGTLERKRRGTLQERVVGLGRAPGWEHSRGKNLRIGPHCSLRWSFLCLCTGCLLGPGSSVLWGLAWVLEDI